MHLLWRSLRGQAATVAATRPQASAVEHASTWKAYVQPAMTSMWKTRLFTTAQRSCHLAGGAGGLGGGAGGAGPVAAAALPAARYGRSGMGGGCWRTEKPSATSCSPRAAAAEVNTSVRALSAGSASSSPCCCSAPRKDEVDSSGAGKLSVCRQRGACGTGPAALTGNQDGSNAVPLVAARPKHVGPQHCAHPHPGEAQRSVGCCHAGHHEQQDAGAKQQREGDHTPAALAAVLVCAPLCRRGWRGACLAGCSNRCPGGACRRCNATVGGRRWPRAAGRLAAHPELSATAIPTCHAVLIDTRGSERQQGRICSGRKGSCCLREAFGRRGTNKRPRKSAKRCWQL